MMVESTALNRTRCHNVHRRPTCRRALCRPGKCRAKARPYGENDMDSVILEIRAAEGGDDAKALVREQMAIYIRVAGRRAL